MARHLRPADDLLLPAVAETLSALRPEKVDTAAARLARRYADAIDEAATTAARLEELLKEEPSYTDRIRALKAKVDEQAVLETLGPKLLAALDALQATPKARAVAGKGGAGNARGGKLAAIRDARAG